MNQIIHQEAHNALRKGLRKCGKVNTWIIVKPDRIWISACKNNEKLHPSEFYRLYEDEFIIRTSSLPDIAGEGGAYFPSYDYSGLSFGVEVEHDYPIELLSGFETTRIPQSKYVIFNYPKYSMENHGDSIYSTWQAKEDYDITAQCLKWNLDKMPVFENDDDEMGYTLYFPACDEDRKDYLIER